MTAPTIDLPRCSVRGSLNGTPADGNGAPGQGLPYRCSANRPGEGGYTDQPRPGPGAGGRVGRLPGDPQGTGRVPHGVGPADGGAGGRAPPRPAGTADGRYRRDRGGFASAGPSPPGGPGPRPHSAPPLPPPP